MPHLKILYILIFVL